MVDRINQYETVKLPEYMHEDLPKPGQICVIVGTEVSKQCGPSVHYLCPCGCGKEIFLPCHTPEEPRKTEPKWGLKLTGEQNLVTLHPSIQDNGPCRSHYHIRDGKVEWC